MYYLTDYGATKFTKARLFGICTEKYANQTPSYNGEYVSRFDSNVLSKNNGEQYALEMSDLTGLPEFFLDKVVEGVPSGNWFVPTE
jgi:hypothetical protein